jgi:hypothetical protein
MIIKGDLRIHKGCTNHGPYIYGKFYFESTMKKCVFGGKEFIDKKGTFDIKEVEVFQISLN